MTVNVHFSPFANFNFVQINSFMFQGSALPFFFLFCEAEEDCFVQGNIKAAPFEGLLYFCSIRKVFRNSSSTCFMSCYEF